MATITSRDIIETMLANCVARSEADGCYPSDQQLSSSQASSIWEYQNVGNGEVMWAVFMDEAHNDLGRNPYVGEAMMLWSKSEGHVFKIGTLQDPRLSQDHPEWERSLNDPEAEFEHDPMDACGAYDERF